MNKTITIRKFANINKLIFLAIMFFLTLLANAQSNITIKGKLIDKETSSPIEEATVYISRVKDSTVIEYTISDKNGIFKIETGKIMVPFFLKIAATGYQNHTLKENSGTENKDFGVLSLLKKEVILSEVVVKSEAPPIRIKKDTLEFNASSFKVRPDANVETLLRQLPGVQIDANKKITINGKPVDKILVDGKPFFSEDGQIAIQNLPADMIKKVQVSSTKTREQEILKQESISNNSTINLTLKEDKNKGLFGKFLGGYGTDNRYESSALASYFKNKRRISGLFSSNNINSTGFSMDEVFDNMGGGRSGAPVPTFSGVYGITRSNQAGINYDDQLAKDFDTHASYMYNNYNFENHNKTSMVTILPTGNFRTESEATNTSKWDIHNADMKFDYAIDSKTKISYVPKFSKENTENDYENSSLSKDENDQLMNKSNSTSKSLIDRSNFNSNLIIGKTFEKKGRTFSGTLGNTNSTEENNSVNNSATLFYQGNNPDDVRNQNALTKKQREYYTSNFYYSEPISDSVTVFARMEYRIDKQSEEKNTFDFNSATASYTDRNELMSNYYSSKQNQILPMAGIMIEKKKFFFRTYFAPRFIEFDHTSLYLSNDVKLTKKYNTPTQGAYLNYKFSKTKTLLAFYNSSLTFPTVYQLMPVVNLSDPLRTYVGNPDLGLEIGHNANVRFNTFNTASNRGFTISANGDYYEDKIVSTAVYNENGKQTSTYTNVSGIYRGNLGIYWNKTIKSGAHKYTYSLSFGTGYDHNKGYTNAELYTAKSINVSPAIRLIYEYGELFTLMPSYNFTYYDSHYTNYSVDATSSGLHNAKIEATNYIHKQWVFGNDFGYTYNTNISDGYNKDFYLWNTSLSYKSKDDQWTFKFKVYDILNQNQNSSRTISPTAVVDSENTILKRYGMFTLSYKFRKFGKTLGTKEEEKK